MLLGLALCIFSQVKKIMHHPHAEGLSVAGLSLMALGFLFLLILLGRRRHSAPPVKI